MGVFNGFMKLEAQRVAKNNWLTYTSYILLLCCYAKDRKLFHKYKYDVISYLVADIAATVPLTLYLSLFAAFVNKSIPIPDRVCPGLSLTVWVFLYCDVAVLAAITLRRGYKIIWGAETTRKMYLITAAVCIAPLFLIQIQQINVGEVVNEFCTPSYFNQLCREIRLYFVTAFYYIAVIGNIAIAAKQITHGRGDNSRKRREEFEVSLAFVLYSLFGMVGNTLTIIRHHNLVATSSAFREVINWMWEVREFTLVANAVITVIVITDFRRAGILFIRDAAVELKLCQPRVAEDTTGFDAPTFDNESDNQNESHVSHTSVEQANN